MKSKKILLLLGILFNVGIILGSPNYSDNINIQTKNNVSSKQDNDNINSESFVIYDGKNINNLFERNDRLDLFNKISSCCSKFTSLKLDYSSLINILTNKEESIILEIPYENANMILNLKRVNIYSDDFISKLSSGESNNEKPGLFYRGMVSNIPNSIVSLSLFDNFVMGMISNAEGNIVISAVKNSENNFDDNYVIYNDIDLKVKNNFICSTIENTTKLNIDEPKFPLNVSAQRPVKIYFECDYQLYSSIGSSNVNSFVTSNFNSIAALYQNENIPIQLSEIYKWNTPDPYMAYSTSSEVLKKFCDTKQDNFNGDIGQLLSFRDIGGGIAWMDVLCSSYNAQYHTGRLSVLGNMNSQIIPLPTYSWNVGASAHELGHNFGSPHTHSCTWPGGPLDSCYTAEGSCSRPLRANYNGTIMSYCHLNGAINLSRGFGALPGDLIRTKYYSAPCLSQGTTQILSQNFSSATFPPSNWAININNFGTNYWSRSNVNAFNNSGTGSAIFDFYNAAAGVYQDFFTPTFTSVTSSNNYLRFAHAYRSASSNGHIGVDQLVIYTSTNGGTNFSTLITYNGGQNGPLVTAAPSQTPYLSPASNEWLWKQIALPVGTNRIVFRAYSDYGNNLFIDEITVGPQVGINSISSNIPKSFSLYQNYPNPFNPATIIKFTIPKNSFVSIKVFDIVGREVKDVINQNLIAGEYKVDFDGSSLESGIYFYRIIAGDFYETRKMILLK